MPLTLTRSQVRRIMIRAQGLDRQRPARAARDILTTIERMGMLQIDTLSVVNRSHYFVLWSRHGAYPLAWLDQLLVDRKIFECWTHEACFAPPAWFPYHRRLLADTARGTKTQWATKLLATHRAAADAMKDHIRTHGSVRANSFARPSGERKDWWDWTHEKQLLEALFACGDVMIARREGFQRVYALTETIRPDWDESQLPGRVETAEYQILATARALGVVHSRWLGDYYRMQSSLQPFVAALVARGQLLEVAIEGIAGPAYLLPETHAALARLTKPVHGATLLSPFDPLVWDRKRALELFNFEYRIECYTPAHKRVYGYFTLPILLGERLIGRVDCKVDRAARVFAIKALHDEPGVVLRPSDATALAAMYWACTQWHGATVIDSRGIDSGENGQLLRAALAAGCPPDMAGVQ